MSTTAFRACAVVPTYDNPRTIAGVVERLREVLPEVPVLVVDDGSHEAGREAVAALAERGLAHVVRRPVNGGKGAAVKDGLREAARLAFTHALQVDADGQHDLDDAPHLLAAARRAPHALVLGTPRFDASAPRARLAARQLTVFWTRIETDGTPVIADPQCGFRVYPVGAALAADARGDRMDFDIEIAVRMVWNGCPVINVPTHVRYLRAEDGGVSHFRVVRDNLAISLMHSRLVLTRWAARLRGRPRVHPVEPDP